ncbi:type IV pilus modification protein PilV [Povalibacter sp.]|uniref:type IV pilus modification protein PilV n=1 Tax=Povalibacter sp. TaxID=1962978 RepID=UPI002F3E4545
MTQMMAQKTTNRGSRIGGFSMVEVLVALIVLGVGMLGIASLYVVTLRSSGSAISRMQAVNLASDLGDRIRANRTAREAYEGAPATTGSSCVGDSAVCNPTQMAAHDLFTWQQQIAAALPGDATGTVVIDNTTNPITYRITVSWTEPGNPPEQLSYVMRLQI